MMFICTSVLGLFTSWYAMQASFESCVLRKKSPITGTGHYKSCRRGVGVFEYPPPQQCTECIVRSFKPKVGCKSSYNTPEDKSKGAKNKNKEKQK